MGIYKSVPQIRRSENLYNTETKGDTTESLKQIFYFHI